VTVGVHDLRASLTTVTAPWTTAPLAAARDGAEARAARRSAGFAGHSAEGGTLEGTGFSPYVDAASEPRALALEGNISEESLPASRPRVILLSAQGRPFTQALARELAADERVVLVCGRYEGVDERINHIYCDMELSIGDYVLSGANWLQPW